MLTIDHYSSSLQLFTTVYSLPRFCFMTSRNIIQLIWNRPLPPFSCASYVAAFDQHFKLETQLKASLSFTIHTNSSYQSSNKYISLSSSTCRNTNATVRRSEPTRWPLRQRSTTTQPDPRQNHRPGPPWHSAL